VNFPDGPSVLIGFSFGWLLCGLALCAYYGRVIRDLFARDTPAPAYRYPPEVAAYLGQAPDPDPEPEPSRCGFGAHGAAVAPRPTGLCSRPCRSCR
jgi:hypothetical protein